MSAVMEQASESIDLHECIGGPLCGQFLEMPKGKASVLVPLRRTQANVKVYGKQEDPSPISCCPGLYVLDKRGYLTWETA